MNAQNGYADLLGVDDSIVDFAQVDTLFVDTISALSSTNITVANDMSTKSIVPATDATYNLGSASKRWADIYGSGALSFSSIDLTAAANQIRMGATNKTIINAAPPVSNRTYLLPDIGVDSTFALLGGTIQIFDGLKAFTFGIPILATSNQLTLGTGNTIVINAPTPAASVTYTVPDVGGASSFVMTTGAQVVSSKTMDSWDNIEILRRASFSVGANKFGINRSSVDGRVYFDQGTGSVGSFVFRLNNGATTVMTAGSASIDIPSKINITATSNQLTLGTTNTTTISATAPAASRTYTIPDVLANSSFAMLAGTQTFNGAKTFSSPVTVTDTTNATSKSTGAVKISGGLGVNNDIWADAILITPRSVAPTFGTSGGGFFVDTSANINFVAPIGGSSGGYNFSNNASTFMNVSPTNGLNIGLISMNYQHTLNTTNFPALYNPTLNDLSIYGRNSLSFELLSGASTALPYMTMDPTNMIQASQRVRVTDTTNATNLSNGSLSTAGGATIAKDIVHNGQHYFATVTSPTNGYAPACIGNINNVYTGSAKLVGYSKSDSTSSYNYNLIGPRYIGYGAMTSTRLTTAATWYKVPMSPTGGPGSTGDRWTNIGLIGSGQGVWTAPVAGTYRFTASMGSPYIAGNTYVFAVWKNPTFAAVDANGSYAITGGSAVTQTTIASSGSIATFATVTYTGELAASDRICFGTYSSSGSPTTTGGSSNYSVEAVY